MKKKMWESCSLWMGIIGFVLLGLLACSSNDSEEEVVPELTTSVTELTFSCEENKGSFMIKSNVEFEVSSSQSWCQAVLASAYSCQVTVEANTLTAERKAEIKVSGGGLVRTVTVTQAAAQPKEEEKVEEAFDDETVVRTDNAAWTMADKLGLGWNLGNQMDAHNNGYAQETAWGNQEATQTTFNKVAAAGFTSVRIPVTWLGRVGEAPDYTIESAWLERVAELVGYAKTAGLNVIINIHHDGADSNYWLDIKEAAKDAEVNEAVKARLKAIWTQIAERFKDEGDYLVFESVNEIHDGGWGWGENRTDGGKQYATLNEWNQVFVDAVRAVGGCNATRYLGIPSYCTNPDYAIEDFYRLPDDEAGRLLVSVHYYAPTDYTLTAKYSQWGHTAQANLKDSWGDEYYLRDTFKKLKEKFVDNGVPVYIGEFGCVHRTTEKAESFRKYYLEFLCKAAHTYGLAPFYWDNGATGAGNECSGLLNHATGELINNAQEVIEVMKKGIFTDDESYVLGSVYANAPR